MERLNYDLMFRWLVGLGMDGPVWNHSTFPKSRDRLMRFDIDELFFDAIKQKAYAKRLMSREHFSVDGTLLDAAHPLNRSSPKMRTMMIGVVMPRTRRLPTLMRSCFARVKARKRNCVTWVTY